MTVDPFPAPQARPPKLPQGAKDGPRANIEPFPLIPRCTARLRRHPTAEDFARGNLVRPFPPRVGKITLLLADTAAEAARDRHAALKARAAARARPTPTRLHCLIAWAGAPVPPPVAVLIAGLAGAVVLGLLLGAWS